MSLFTDANAVEVKEGVAQSVVTTTIKLPAQLEQLAGKLEKLGFQLHEAGMIGAGKAPTGAKMVPFCAMKKGPAGTQVVTVYYNGSTTWTGIAPIALK